jgi:hypothetical protein
MQTQNVFDWKALLLMQVYEKIKAQLPVKFKTVLKFTETLLNTKWGFRIIMPKGLYVAEIYVTLSYETYDSDILDPVMYELNIISSTKSKFLLFVSKTSEIVRLAIRLSRANYKNSTKMLSSATEYTNILSSDKKLYSSVAKTYVPHISPNDTDCNDMYNKKVLSTSKITDDLTLGNINRGVSYKEYNKIQY